MTHTPDDTSRAKVEALAQYLTQEQVATHLGISENTLRRHYRDELDRGALRANNAVAQNLFAYASGKKGSEKAHVTAAIFWCKVRMGWRETVNINDVTDPNANARERLAAKLGRLDEPAAENGAPPLAAPIGRA